PRPQLEGAEAIDDLTDPGFRCFRQPQPPGCDDSGSRAFSPLWRELSAPRAPDLIRPAPAGVSTIRPLHEFDERAQLARRVGAIGVVDMKRLVRRQEGVEDRNDG